MRNRGFTLIELLVVIAIIAVLMSVIIPSLRIAKRQAKLTICMSNLRQVTIGALTYESSNRRLPPHLWEMSMNASGQSQALPKQIVMGLVDPQFDVRPYYQDYVSVNYFKCPLVPDWNRDVSDLASDYNIYTDYFMSGGYWGSVNKGEGWSSLLGNNDKIFTQSSNTWSFGGYKFNVMYGDCLWKAISHKQLRTNHSDKNTANKFILEPPNTSRWVEAFFYGNYSDADEADTFAEEIKSNYAFTDGSVAPFRGDDNKMVEVVHRRDYNYSFYIPHK